MAERWAEFVARCIVPPPDDPYVRLLKERLSSGCTLVRTHLIEAEGREPEYLVVLDCRKQLVDMRVPHSESFTRWSLEAGVRLADHTEESARFALLFGERMAQAETEAGGRNNFGPLVAAAVRSLAPPRAVAALGSFAREAQRGPASERTAAAVEETLAGLARALGGALGYSTAEAADILDGAVERFVEEYLHLPLRRQLGL